MYKIIGADGKEYGPITADQLRQWIAEGRANALTKILPEGSTEWKPLSDFPEFSGLASSAPPPFGQAPAPSLAAADQVNGPAIGLMVVAILSGISQLVSLVLHFVGASILAATQMHNSPAWLNMFSGTLSIMGSIVGLLVSALILAGALKMKKLENYALAITASVLAMIPCSLCCVVGLPIGIWALVVLTKPEVKSAFH